MPTGWITNMKYVFRITVKTEAVVSNIVLTFTAPERGVVRTNLILLCKTCWRWEIIHKNIGSSGKRRRIFHRHLKIASYAEFVRNRCPPPLTIHPYRSLPWSIEMFITDIVFVISTINTFTAKLLRFFFGFFPKFFCFAPLKYVDWTLWNPCILEYKR